MALSKFSDSLPRRLIGSEEEERLASDELTAHLRGLGAAGLLLAVVGSVALVAPQAASADTPHAAPSSVPSIQSHDVAGFPGTSTTAPFNECPQIG